MLIAQLSDLHVGGGRYREELLRTAIAEINAAAPDVVVIAGDLTDDGYPDQYPLAKKELDALTCAQIVRVPGNHDARNVGYLRFEDTFGARDSRLLLELGGLETALVAGTSGPPKGCVLTHRNYRAVRIGARADLRCHDLRRHRRRPPAR